MTDDRKFRSEVTTENVKPVILRSCDIVETLSTERWREEGTGSGV